MLFVDSPHKQMWAVLEIDDSLLNTISRDSKYVDERTAFVKSTKRSQIEELFMQKTPSLQFTKNPNPDSERSEGAKNFISNKLRNFHGKCWRNSESEFNSFMSG